MACENRYWYNVELEKEEAPIFKEYLKKNNIMYEPSEAYNLIHFQCFMNFDELYEANQYLDKLFGEQ